MNIGSRQGQIVVGVVLSVVAAMLALVVASVVLNARDAARDTSELLRQGKQDRACLVALALELGDPGRDRTIRPPLPPACQGSTAAEEAVRP